jgi:hypothetical protein
MRRGVIGALGVGLLLVFAACGQTDYATDVTEDGAQLNGTITTLAEDVTTTAWFEYWPTANPSNKQQTPDQDVTSTGPLNADVGSLANQTEYQYRLCGTEDDSQVVCAQTRRFTTGRATVQGYGYTDFVGDPLGVRERFQGLDFDAVAGSSGLSGPAFVVYELDAGSSILTFPLGSRTTPTVTCFDVEGNTAVIGLHNAEQPNVPQSFVQLVDGGPLGSGQDGLAALVNDLPPDSPDRDPSDCSPIQKPLIPLISGEIVVNEAPPGPT